MTLNNYDIPYNLNNAKAKLHLIKYNYIKG